MRQSLAIFVIFLSHIWILPAQNHDYHWILGYTPIHNNGTVILDFNTQPVSSHTETLHHAYSDFCAICSDSSGQNLLFHSNGIRIFNKNNQVMANGDSFNINPPSIWNAFRENGYTYAPGHFTLPDPAGGNIYYVFHTGIDVWASNDTINYFNVFSYTVIDMNLENGLGRVVKKNQLLFDSLPMIQSTAVKHGNGRDWWIVTRENYQPIFHVFLLSPNGLEGPYDQTIGPDFVHQCPPRLISRSARP